MSTYYGVSFIQDNCIQCHGCEVACKSWRCVELGARWRRVEHIWKGSYPGVKNVSASVACMHCVAPACVEACPEGAITKRDGDGVVVIDSETCTGCETCREACPFDVPQFGRDGKMQKCDMCVDEIDYSAETPPCVRTCPTQALKFVQMSIEEKMAVEKNIGRLI